MKKALIAATTLLLASCGGQQSTEESSPVEVAVEAPVWSASDLTPRQKIRQKIILDLRYFCDDGTPGDKCRQPVTSLNSYLERLLRDHTPGGIILFAENIETPDQTRALIDDMQATADSGETRIPLLVSVDQEGGKVTRLPLDWASGLFGNMTIAAAPARERGELAFRVGQTMGRELAALGFNVNHAPVLDVNVNPDNPVINVRSFSDNPAVVGELGAALASGLLEAGVAPTLKHFPGHGDTSVDSHYGLPRVDHDLETVEKIDLAPFKTVIDSGNAPIIMTAHIQYPALDDTKMVDLQGDEVIVPATFSRKIMTELLRDKLHFEGVTTTDALDMRAISLIADKQGAVVRTFRAGIDMAVMPLPIRTPADIEEFEALVSDVLAAGLDLAETEASVGRILTLKQSLRLHEQADDSKNESGIEIDNDLEAELASKSITVLKSTPGLMDGVKKITVIMPTQDQADAMHLALQEALGDEVRVYGIGIGTRLGHTMRDWMYSGNLVIGGNITPKDSPVDLGGMDDAMDGLSQDQKIMKLLEREFVAARRKGRKTAFVSLRFPTDALSILDQVDAAWALYNFKTRRVDGRPASPTFEAFADILAGKAEAVGKLPMQLVNEPVPGAERADLLLPTLAGKRLGLVVNQSSLVGDQHLVDYLLGNEMSVQSLFAVEHGIRGKADAGAVIKDGRDSKTGLPVVSLYGSKKQPAAEDLAEIDTLVFDLQDVGVRFYTYISSLHYVMEACAATGTPLVVLDRPNPNGRFIDGPLLDPAFRSFVGMHRIPLLHGLTLGEAARMINGEGWLSGGAQCELTIIPVGNYTHSLPYDLAVRPSPNLPNAKSVQFYASLALFEATGMSIGRGTPFPFQVIGGNHEGFGSFSFTPVSTPGAALAPKHMDVPLKGVDLRASVLQGLDLTHFMAWRDRAAELGVAFLTRPDWLDKLMGTDAFRKQLEAGASEAEIRASWADDLAAYRSMRQKYLLYPD